MTTRASRGTSRDCTGSATERGSTGEVRTVRSRSAMPVASCSVPPRAAGSQAAARNVEPRGAEALGTADQPVLALARRRHRGQLHATLRPQDPVSANAAARVDQEGKTPLPVDEGVTLTTRHHDAALAGLGRPVNLVGLEPAILARRAQGAVVTRAQHVGAPAPARIEERAHQHELAAGAPQQRARLRGHVRLVPAGPERSARRVEADEERRPREGHAARAEIARHDDPAVTGAHRRDRVAPGAQIEHRRPLDRAPLGEPRDRRARRVGAHGRVARENERPALERRPVKALDAAAFERAGPAGLALGGGADDERARGRGRAPRARGKSAVAVSEHEEAAVGGGHGPVELVRPAPAVGARPLRTHVRNLSHREECRAGAEASPGVPEEGAATVRAAKGLACPVRARAAQELAAPAADGIRAPVVERPHRQRAGATRRAQARAGGEPESREDRERAKPSA